MAQRSFFYINKTWINRKHIIAMKEMPGHGLDTVCEITFIGGLKLYVTQEDVQRILVGVKQLG